VTALPSSLRLSDPLSVSFDNGDQKWVKAYFGWLSFNGWRPGCSSADSSVSSYRVSICGSCEPPIVGGWVVGQECPPVSAQCDCGAENFWVHSRLSSSPGLRSTRKAVLRISSQHQPISWTIFPLCFMRSQITPDHFTTGSIDYENEEKGRNFR
jgi:hypothetical protein